jgi:ubiquinone/menaquinone biosynthesis C-methylase UbiE
MINLKNEVYKYWERQSCGTEYSAHEKYSKEYFEDIERVRYDSEPDIFEFAQFTRYHKKKVLEVGVGAGTDFLQWVRAGAFAYGVDLTDEAISNVLARLKVYGLECCELRRGDAEELPFGDNVFDLVYSWGVIHHSPNTLKALHEIIRVVKPGGRCKIMIYNTHSVRSVFMYLRYALFKGRPFRSLKEIYFNHQESPGTKVHTVKEVETMLRDFPVHDVRIYAPLLPREVYLNAFGGDYRRTIVQNERTAKTLFLATLFFFFRQAAHVMGYFDSGFYLKIEFAKSASSTLP